MRKILVLFTFLSLSGCADDYGSRGTPSPPSQAVVDQNLEGFRNRFIEYSYTALGREVLYQQVNLNFADLGYTVEKGGTNGRCSTGPGILPTIEIDRLFWSGADDARRENLMFHELGHCLLGRAHVETTDRLGYPISVMYPYTLSSNLYAGRRTQYIAELFQGSKYYSPQPSIPDDENIVHISFVDKNGDQQGCEELPESRSHQ